MPKIGKIKLVFNNSQNLFLFYCSFKRLSFLLVKVGRIFYICTRKAERTLFLIAGRTATERGCAVLFCVTFGVTLVSLTIKCNFSVTFLKVLENLICL